VNIENHCFKLQNRNYSVKFLETYVYFTQIIYQWPYMVFCYDIRAAKHNSAGGKHFTCITGTSS